MHLFKQNVYTKNEIKYNTIITHFIKHCCCSIIFLFRAFMELSKRMFAWKNMNFCIANVLEIRTKKISLRFCFFFFTLAVKIILLLNGQQFYILTREFLIKNLYLSENCKNLLLHICTYINTYTSNRNMFIQISITGYL